MALRSDNVGIVVDDDAPTIELSRELGLGHDEQPSFGPAGE
ncbi:MAG: hypothetical protein ABIR68_18690 [Ilumatobacteraceae bacterium]